MMIEILNRIVKDHLNPPLFENGKTQEDFWDNEHISKMMLMAHLNPNWDAASRKPETIKATCNWILSTLGLEPGQKIMDLGCGPGLYATEFCDYGLEVVGVDYSKRSIDYARQQAGLKQQAIDYRYQNYLEIEDHGVYDVITLIYCDFGVLSQSSRTQLLQRIFRALKPGGYFVFDVWSTAYEELTAAYKNWVIHEKTGFWKSEPHLELIHKTYDQETAVSLKQHIIVQEQSEISVFNLWEQCYTPESIEALLIENGFDVVSVVSDLTGANYTPESKSIGIVAKKAEGVHLLHKVV